MCWRWWGDSGEGQAEGEELWRKSDGLLRKEESNGNVAGAKMKTTTIYEYDPNIRIEAPI